MSYRVLITDRALSDLREIRDYIARRSPLNTAGFLQRLLKGFDVIEASPESFAKATEDEFVPYTLRQFVVKPYRVLYRIVGHRVEILHIRHGARLPASPGDLI
jgi:plasmid stabilization system protein ParE